MTRQDKTKEKYHSNRGKRSSNQSLARRVVHARTRRVVLMVEVMTIYVLTVKMAALLARAQCRASDMAQKQSYDHELQ
jgi:hypothetical protein